MFNESNVVKVTTLKLTVNKLIVTYRIAGYFRRSNISYTKFLGCIKFSMRLE